MPLPNNRRSVNVGNNVFENLYVYGDCEFDKDVTINGQLKYDELSLVRLTVTDKITAGIVTATTYYGDGSTLTGIVSIPAGAVFYFASSSAPTGYVKANGAELSKTTYATLFSSIGTTYGETDGAGGAGTSHFRVPDLRGEFIRGWDDGRGVDSDRAFGSTQSQMFEDHKHALFRGSTETSGSRDSNGYATIDTTDLTATTNPSAISFASYSQRYTVTWSTGSETRPRNVALLACIKY